MEEGKPMSAWPTKIRRAPRAVTLIPCPKEKGGVRVRVTNTGMVFYLAPAKVEKAVEAGQVELVEEER
jgi:hypothetical protein